MNVKDFKMPFMLSDDEYKRDINPIRDYIHQASLYLSRVKNIDIQTAENWIKEQLKQTAKVPVIEYSERQENGDKQIKKTTLLKYIKDSLDHQEIIAPTLTTYISADKKESILSSYASENIKARSIAKKAMFAAEVSKDYQLRDFKNSEQSNAKLFNNALSGMFISAFNPLHNPSSHSTLTSNCRITTAYGNANNEKFLSGNRHYWSAHIVLNNVMSIITHIDEKKIADTIKHYSLYIPTIEDCIDCIEYSSRLYWDDSRQMQRIKELVSTLTDVQRAAFVYIGDLWHLKKHNPDLIRGFITKLSTKVDTANYPDTQETIDTIIKPADESVSILANNLHKETMAGIGSDYKSFLGKGIVPLIASTIVNILTTLNEYRLLIESFFTTDNAPCTISYFPSSIRRSVLTGDTDSSLFHVQRWCKWIAESYTSSHAHRVGQTMIFLSAQTVAHLLARMSINNGFSKRHMHLTVMKNEFYFPVFVPTPVNKHYFASIAAQEGIIYEKYKREIKGVHLKNSNVPAKITQKADELMYLIMDTVMKGEKISLVAILKQVADFERSVMQAVKKGDEHYLRKVNIKTADSYNSDPLMSPHFHIDLFNSVFGPKYGTVKAPTPAVAINTTLTTPMKLNAYLESLEDKELSKRFKDFLIASNKSKLPTLLIPTSILSVVGMPHELESIIDARVVVTRLCKIFYLILATLGYYPQDRKSTTIVSDLF